MPTCLKTVVTLTFSDFIEADLMQSLTLFENRVNEEALNWKRVTLLETFELEAEFNFKDDILGDPYSMSLWIKP